MPTSLAGVEEAKKVALCKGSLAKTTRGTFVEASRKPRDACAESTHASASTQHVEAVESHGYPWSEAARKVLEILKSDLVMLALSPAIPFLPAFIISYPRFQPTIKIWRGNAFGSLLQFQSYYVTATNPFLSASSISHFPISQN